MQEVNGKVKSERVSQPLNSIKLHLESIKFQRSPNHAQYAATSGMKKLMRTICPLNVSCQGDILQQIYLTEKFFIPFNYYQMVHLTF